MSRLFKVCFALAVFVVFYFVVVFDCRCALYSITWWRAGSPPPRLRLSVLTLSGFSANNKLRSQGDINLYVPNSEYGFVEIMHLTLCHAILDLAMGWHAGEFE